MTIIERILSKCYLNCCLPSDSVFAESIDKHIGCQAEVVEHGENYVILKLISDENEVKAKFNYKPLSYDESRFSITEIKEVK